jgi:hypothetical protein
MPIATGAVPLVAGLSSNIFAAWCMANTRRSSPIRLLVLAAAVLTSRVTYLTCTDFSGSIYWDSLPAGYSFLVFAIIANQLLFTGVDPDDLARLRTEYGYKWRGFRSR